MCYALIFLSIYSYIVEHPGDKLPLSRYRLFFLSKRNAACCVTEKSFERKLIYLPFHVRLEFMFTALGFGSVNLLGSTTHPEADSDNREL